ncbi:uncharacterized protein LOC135945871 [Cloeon dipterum]|uniref:uncharacterized protein LOC135945871 n=1 Tax=Cloeon dipterum TaxID=197152 RepID=UPI00321F7EE4
MSDYESESDDDNIEDMPPRSSLQYLAISTIVNNIGSYGERIRKYISPPIRKILFEKAKDRKRKIGVEQIWAALPYLDQHRTTEKFNSGDFSSIFRLKRKNGGEISEARVSMEEFLQYLAEFVPNLRELFIEDPRPCGKRKQVKRVRLEEPLASDLLLRIENLTHLLINNVNINFSGFIRVCTESQKLQHIKANNILVDIEPDATKKCLKMLDSKFDHQEHDARKFPRKLGITLQKSNAAGPYLKAIVTLSDDFLHLRPTLTCLHISAQRDKDLTVDDIKNDRNRLLLMLKRAGGTFKTLILEFIRPKLNITFKHISKHCNDLETLELLNSYVLGDDSITSFSQLKIFKWHNMFHYWDWTIRLDRILSAPHLETMDIIALKMNLGDNKESLFHKIRNRTILDKATFIRIMSIAYYEYGKDPDQEALCELARELRIFSTEPTMPVERTVSILIGNHRAINIRNT